MKKGLKELLAEANAEIETIAAEEAVKQANDDNVIFVDLRDSMELQQQGKIPGAMHVPRGLLEFTIDPSSPLHKQEISSGKRIIFYCGTGGRSALATKTAQDMGIENTAHVGGGFNAWKDNNGPVESM